MEGDALATLPNLISLSRLVLAAAFVVFRGTGARLAIVAAAGATDYLDGYFARRRGPSSWGALIDPIADRFFVFTAVCALLFDDTLETWQYAVLISRDFMTAIGFLIARVIPRLRRVRFKSRMSGKVVQVMQLITLALLFVAPRFLTPALVIVGAASIYSVTDYTVTLWQARDRS